MTPPPPSPLSSSSSSLSQPDGVMNYYHIPYLVDLISYATIDVPDFKVPVPEQFRVPGQWRYSLYIPGSAQACVSTFGKNRGWGMLRLQPAHAAVHKEFQQAWQ